MRAIGNRSYGSYENLTFAPLPPIIIIIIIIVRNATSTTKAFEETLPVHDQMGMSYAALKLASEFSLDLIKINTPCTDVEPSLTDTSRKGTLGYVLSYIQTLHF